MIIATGLLSLTSFSQLPIVSTPTRVVIYQHQSGDIKLSALIIKGDTSYLVTYQNDVYETLVDIQMLSFKNKEEVYQLTDLSINVEEDVTTSMYSVAKIGETAVLVFISSHDYFIEEKESMSRMKEALIKF